MRTAQEISLLWERAVMLRRQGESLRQIKEALGPTRRPYGKTWARTITAACASTSTAAQTSTARSKAGQPQAWRDVARKTSSRRAVDTQGSADTAMAARPVSWIDGRGTS